MFTSRNSNNFLILMISLLFLVSALILNKNLTKPQVIISKQDSAINVNSNFLEFIAMGNKRLIANVFWIQTLMESDLEKYFKQDYGNWMYLRFLTISKIDPRFYENYLYGGMYLSIVKDDLLGAADLFERGLVFYPQDFKLNYYAGFNYYYELGDYEKGFTLLKRIENHPKTDERLRFIISKLRYETTGNYEVALAFLSSSYEMARDEIIKKKLLKDIYALKAEHDLECLNSGRKDCTIRDAFGDYYYRDQNGKWVSRQNFLPYKIFRSPEAIKRHPSPDKRFQ